MLEKDSYTPSLQIVRYYRIMMFTLWQLGHNISNKFISLACVCFCVAIWVQIKIVVVINSIGLLKFLSSAVRYTDCGSNSIILLGLIN